MNNKLKTLLISSMAAMMLLSACTGDNTDGEANDDNAVDIPIAPFAADTVVGTIEGTETPTEITAKEYASYVYSVKQQVENFALQSGLDPSTMWGENDEFAESIRLDVEESIVVDYAFDALLANYNAESTDEIKEELATQRAQLVETFGGEEGFATALADFYLTEGEFMEDLERQLIMEDLQNGLYGSEGTAKPTDEEILELVSKENYIAQHILFSTVDDAGAPLSDEDIDAARAEAEKTLEELKAGADFDTLMAERSEDPGSATNPEGYFFTEGDMVTEFYEGTKALEEGAISEIVESSFGYHIIKRLPIDQEYLDDNRASLESLASDELFFAEIDAEIAKLTFTGNDKALEISTDNSEAFLQ